MSNESVMVIKVQSKEFSVEVARVAMDLAAEVIEEWERDVLPMAAIESQQDKEQQMVAYAIKRLMGGSIEAFVKRYAEK